MKIAVGDPPLARYHFVIASDHRVTAAADRGGVLNASTQRNAMYPLLLHDFARALTAEQVRNAERARPVVPRSISQHADRRGIPRLYALPKLGGPRKERGVACFGDYRGAGRQP